MNNVICGSLFKCIPEVYTAAVRSSLHKLAMQANVSSSKMSPEYRALHEYLNDICNAFSRLPDNITPLARDLCSADIIPPATMSAITASRLAPFDRAHTVMSAAQVSVEQNPMRFDVLVEKLSDQGLSQLAERMHSRCGKMLGCFYICILL